MFNIHLNNFCLFADTSLDDSLIENGQKENLFEEEKIKSDIEMLKTELECIKIGNICMNNNYDDIPKKNTKIENLSCVNKIVGTALQNEKTSISQHSIINSNSTLNNKIALMQTDSSFFSAYEDNNILNNNLKGN